jgi:transcriptional regulator with PAS, ATPase and Fis domain
VIQDGEVRRVGETQARRVDVRIVAATNRVLADEVEAGRFRGDLRYRLEVVRIAVLPLRERPEDIAVLARAFWADASARTGTRAVLHPATLAALARYHWPGNVRELQNAIAGLAVEAPTRGQVRPALLPAALTGATAVHAGRLADARAQFERRFVEVALARAGGSRSRAARELGLSRQGRTERSWTAWSSMAPVEMCGTRHSCAEQLGLGSLPGAWGAEDDAIEAPAVGSGHGRPATQDLFQID